jgi:hypothetical protein
MPFGLGGQWVKADGLVVASRDHGLGLMEYVIEVHPDGGEPFRTDMKRFYSSGFWPPIVGQTVGVEYDPKSHAVRFDKSDSRTNVLARPSGAEKAQQDQAFDDALAGRIPAAPDPALVSLDRDLQELAGPPAASPAQAPAADGKVGLEFQFAATGQPAAGQVQSVVSAVSSGVMRTTEGTADEILATGTHGTAVITTASPLGKTVRDINPNADPSRLNDPMWLFTIEVALAGQQPFPAFFRSRVPLAKLATVAPGVRLAVAVNPADYEVAIDWDKSPLT